MRKRHESILPNSCFNKAKDHEMLFVLIGRDPAAAETIRVWCALRISKGLNKITDAKIVEALECADTIERELRGVVRHAAELGPAPSPSMGAKIQG